MNKTVDFELFFSNIDLIANTIQNECEVTYLEALVQTGELLFQGELKTPISEVTHKKIFNYLASIKLELFSKEQIRKAFQLAILKGMKEATQANHLMTPDAVAIFISYLVSKMTENANELRMLDPAIGTGNLVTTILNHSPKKIDCYGVEPDETLLKLAYVNANLQEHNIELFHQDGLLNIFIDPVDIVVTDLPVGHYPNEKNAERFHLRAVEGMSLTHHLLIEQSLTYTKDGGYLLFLIPNFLFETAQSKQLHEFIKKHAFIYSLLQLPKTMFKDEKQAKSIFILRKKQDGLKAPSQALLAELPSFSNKHALSEMVTSINNWFDAYLK